MIIYFNDTNNITKNHIFNFFYKCLFFFTMFRKKSLFIFYKRKKSHISVYFFRDLGI